MTQVLAHLIGPDPGASTSHGYTPSQLHAVASEAEHEDVPTQASDAAGPSDDPHLLRTRPRQPAEHYTPGSGALPHQYKRRRLPRN